VPAQKAETIAPSTDHRHRYREKHPSVREIPDQVDSHFSSRRAGQHHYRRIGERRIYLIPYRSFRLARMPANEMSHICRFVLGPDPAKPPLVLLIGVSLSTNSRQWRQR
jgi:hypothetical protein